MPPQDGITIALFLTVADVERSLRFYETVFGGRVLSRGDSKGASGKQALAEFFFVAKYV
jgi:catechol 2,3-dioxygenase-like lactoylglutathione lyase family enzyme